MQFKLLKNSAEPCYLFIAGLLDQSPVINTLKCTAHGFGYTGVRGDTKTEYGMHIGCHPFACQPVQQQVLFTGIRFLLHDKTHEGYFRDTLAAFQHG